MTNVIDFRTYNSQELGLARALSKKGHEVSIITPDYIQGNEIFKVNNGNDIRVYKVKFIALNKAYLWHFGVNKILNIIKPDIIHICEFNFTMCLYYVLWCKFHHCKSVVIQGSYDATRKPLLRQLMQLSDSILGKMVLKYADGIGCKTLWAKKYVKKYIDKDVFLTRIGLDDSRFASCRDINWREDLSLKEKKILLYVGVQEPRRNPLFLLNLLNSLPLDYVLIMVGMGPSNREIKNFVRDNNLKERVFLLGKQPQEVLPSLYKTSDVFLLASSYEIYGMVLLESMYFGLPVISSVTAGSDCLIENNVDGILINDLDVNIWTDSIQMLTNNKDKYVSMRAAAENKTRSQLVWDKTVDEFLALYNFTLK